MTRYVVPVAAALILVTTSGSLLLGLVTLNTALYIAGRLWPETEDNP